MRITLRAELAHKISRLGFYQPVMINDTKDHVRKCERCKKHALVVTQPLQLLTSIISLIPFTMWEWTSQGLFQCLVDKECFLIVAIDYFTKWIEAKALVKIITNQITQFFWEDVICRYGLPRIMVADNGKQFNNEEFSKYCHHYGIYLRFTSVAHPQDNG